MSTAVMEPDVDEKPRKDPPPPLVHYVCKICWVTFCGIQLKPQPPNKGLPGVQCLVCVDIHDARGHRCKSY